MARSATHAGSTAFLALALLVGCGDAKDRTATPISPSPSTKTVDVDVDFSFTLLADGSVSSLRIELDKLTSTIPTDKVIQLLLEGPDDWQAGFSAGNPVFTARDFVPVGGTLPLSFYEDLGLTELIWGPLDLFEGAVSGENRGELSFTYTYEEQSN